MARKFELITSSPGADPSGTPSDLGVYGAKLWAAIVQEFAVDDPGSRELLRQACKSIDFAESCDELIRREGLTIAVRGKARRDHPLIRHSIASRALGARLLTRLGVTYEEVKPIGRPPRL